MYQLKEPLQRYKGFLLKMERVGLHWNMTSIGLLALAAAMHAVATPAPAQTSARYASTTGNAIRPFRVHVSDSALSDLHRRIHGTRWPDQETVADQSQGAQLARMNHWVRASVLAAAVCVASGSAMATDDPAGGAGHAYGFERFLQRYEAANTAFVNGDPSPWLSITAEKDPASIFGGFGGLGEAGVAEVRQRYLLAASAFRPSGAEVDFEYLVKDVRGRLAYTVAIECANVLYAGHTERQQQTLRATMIFRFEKGTWKIIHRHADTMVDLQLPTP
jgi:ketosteroid isomerase-like protein